jgi:hypothetical protein
MTSGASSNSASSRETGPADRGAPHAPVRQDCQQPPPGFRGYRCLSRAEQPDPLHRVLFGSRCEIGE